MYDEILKRIGVAAAIRLAVLSLLMTASFAAVAQGVTFTVNSATDTSGGSCTATSCNLRQAIAAANATTVRDTIEFNLPACGNHRITIASGTLHISRPVVIDGTSQPLCGAAVPGDHTSPIELRGPGVNVATPAFVTGLVLDSTSSGSTIHGLAINGFSGSGIGVGSSNNSIFDNKIGTNTAGTQALPNRTGSTISAATSGNDVDNNVISGNTGTGISVLGNSTLIYDNLIGTAVDGVTDLGNGGDGIATSGAIDCEIGLGASTGNTIAFNGGMGIRVGTGSHGNTLVGNKILKNELLGIRLDSPSANNGQVAPVITSVLRDTAVVGNPPHTAFVFVIRGTLANATNSFFVDLYANDECDPSGAGEGLKFLQSVRVVSNSSGDAIFKTATTQSVGKFVTAIAQSPDGNSSEFSECAATPQFLGL